MACSLDPWQVGRVDYAFETIELTTFLSIGWRNELYAIYASPQSSALKNSVNKPFGNVAFHLERAACALFGLATFGVHLTGVCCLLVFDAHD